MKVQYDEDFINMVNQHEKKMKTRYKGIIDPYTKQFRQYDCKLKQQMYWRNVKKEIISDTALPFLNGYRCCIGYTVERRGNPIYIENELCDRDELKDSWEVTMVDRAGMRLEAELNDYVAKDEIKLSLDYALEIVQAMFKKKGK